MEGSNSPFRVISKNRVDIDLIMRAGLIARFDARLQEIALCYFKCINRENT